MEGEEGEGDEVEEEGEGDEVEEEGEGEGDDSDAILVMDGN